MGQNFNTLQHSDCFSLSLARIQQVALQLGTLGPKVTLLPSSLMIPIAIGLG